MIVTIHDLELENLSRYFNSTMFHQSQVAPENTLNQGTENVGQGSHNVALDPQPVATGRLFEQTAPNYARQRGQHLPGYVGQTGPRYVGQTAPEYVGQSEPTFTRHQEPFISDSYPYSSVGPGKPSIFVTGQPSVGSALVSIELPRSFDIVYLYVDIAKEFGIMMDKAKQKRF